MTDAQNVESTTPTTSLSNQFLQVVRQPPIAGVAAGTTGLTIGGFLVAVVSRLVHFGKPSPATGAATPHSAPPPPPRAAAAAATTTTPELIRGTTDVDRSEHHADLGALLAVGGCPGLPAAHADKWHRRD